MHVRGFCYFHASFNLGDDRTVDSTVTMLSSNTFGELRAELIHSLWKVCADKTKPEPKDPREALEQLYNFIDTRGQFQNNQILPGIKVEPRPDLLEARQQTRQVFQAAHASTQSH